MNLLSLTRYYLNIIHVKFIYKCVVKYDDHTYSDFFQKRRRYAGRWIHTADESNHYIKEMLCTNDPFMVARFGSTELYNTEVFDLKITFKYDNALNMLCTASGFFPNDKMLAFKFADLIKASCHSVDVLAIWNMFMEEHYIKTEMSKEAYLMPLRFLEPWFSADPWTEGLKGKKVLVIHPFTDTIKKQYQNHEKLFEDKRILPAFELFTVKAVQTVAGEKDDRFGTWFEALEYMYDEAMKIDFDVALIGCGAYGMPLAAKIKAAGKQAVHMGGVLQILFGIKGKRWDDDPAVSKLYNEYWVRPGENEKPKAAKDIEGGCYW